MSRKVHANQEVAGWVVLSPGSVPDSWKSRAVPMMLVPLAPAEAAQLLSHGRVEPSILPRDLSLIHLVARGHSAAEIASVLDVSTRTIHRRVARLSKQFRVSTLQELAGELGRRGFGSERYPPQGERVPLRDNHG